MRLHRVPFIDATGLRTLEEVTKKLEKRGVKVLLCEANARVLGKLQRAGIVGVDTAYSVHLADAVQHAAGPAPAGAELA